MKSNFADISCPNCGVPAEFNIIKGEYLCSHCNGKVGINEAHAQKQGFRSIQQAKIKESAEKHYLLSANCSGCGGTIVFEEGDALSQCPFCGRSLVRKDFLLSEEMPELIIPFRITEDEARNCLLDWCKANSQKKEAKNLEKKINLLKGFYLPYEFVKGPVKSKVSRMDAYSSYNCGGYVDNVFINCSKQLDNMLLDGMEPFELDELQAFDFSYVAGHRVKVGDIDKNVLVERVEQEVSNDYASVVRKTLETKAIEVNTDTSSVFRMPVLLPVYYICSGNEMAAVNGQTGKVSVRSIKKQTYYFIPWWLKAIIATILTSSILFAALLYFDWDIDSSLEITGMFSVVMLIVMLVAYSNTVKNKFKVKGERKIFTSSGGPFRRINGKLIKDKKEIKKNVVPPVFFLELDGKLQAVKLRFSPPLRILRILLLALIILFLPVIIALFLNGFDFARLELGASAFWFCIVVIVIPVFLIKRYRIELYENPWIYIIKENGKEKRYRTKSKIKITKEDARSIGRLFYVPWGCLATWAIIIIFCMMCYLTAFGFD